MTQEKPNLPNSFDDPLASALLSSLSCRNAIGLLHKYQPDNLNEYRFNTATKWFSSGQLDSYSKKIPFDENNPNTKLALFNFLEYYLERTRPFSDSDSVVLPSWAAFKSDKANKSIPFPHSDEILSKSYNPNPSLVAWYLVKLGLDTSRTGYQKVDAHNKASQEDSFWDIATIAFDAGHFEFVHALFDKGGPLENSGYSVKDRVTKTSYRENSVPWLFSVVISQSPFIIKSFIDLGCDPNVRNYLGRTPLFYATSPEVVKVLVENGADPSILDNSGATADSVWNSSGVITAKQKQALSKATLLALKELNKSNPDSVDWKKLREQWIISLPNLSKTSAIPSYKRLDMASDVSINVGDDKNEFNVTPGVFLALNTLEFISGKKITSQLIEWSISISDLSIPISKDSDITNLDMLALCSFNGFCDETYRNANYGYNYKPLSDDLDVYLKQVADQPLSDSESKDEDKGARVARRLAAAALMLSNTTLPLLSVSQFDKNRPLGSIYTLSSVSYEDAKRLHKDSLTFIQSINPVNNGMPSSASTLNFSTLVDLYPLLSDKWSKIKWNKISINDEMVMEVSKSFSSIKYDKKNIDLYSKLSYGFNNQSPNSITSYASPLNNRYLDVYSCLMLRYYLSKDAIDKASQKDASQKDLVSVINLVLGSMNQKSGKTGHINYSVLPSRWQSPVNSQGDLAEIVKSISSAFDIVFDNPESARIIKYQTPSAWKECLRVSDALIKHLKHPLSSNEADGPYLYTIANYFQREDLRLGIFEGDEKVIYDQSQKKLKTKSKI